jgi:hypothetical protein
MARRKPNKLCPSCGNAFQPHRPIQLCCSRQCGWNVRRQSIDERFWSKVNKTETCWLWTASTDPRGYGHFVIHNRLEGAHRVAWILSNGSIPDNLWVLHRCDNPPCVNPAHLFLGTHQDNVADSTRKNRRAKPQGELHGHSTVTSEQVAHIRAAGRGDWKKLHKQFGVSRSNFYKIWMRKSWTHLS